MSTALVGNMISERILQQSFVGMFRAMYPDWQLILSLSGTALFGTAKQKAMTIDEWKLQGWERGLPDLTICLPKSVTVHFELKKPGKLNDQSPEQVGMQHKLTNLDHHYYVLDDVVDMFAILAQHTDMGARRTAFEQFTATLSQPTLSELFLYFPEGTPTADVLDAVKPYYHIKEYL